MNLTSGCSQENSEEQGSPARAAGLWDRGDTHVAVEPAKSRNRLLECAWSKRGSESPGSRLYTPLARVNAEPSASRVAERAPRPAAPPRGGGRYSVSKGPGMGVGKGWSCR